MILPKLAPYVSRAFVTAYGACAVVFTSSSADLPVPCVAGNCGPNGPTTWVTSGSASAVLTGNSLTINQTTNNAVLEWQSFNISADGTVTFKQPDASSVALNRIYQSDPSRIFGALNANGRIYLLNQNGILFGDGARVNVGGLVASSLNITQQAIANGLAGAAQLGQPAFTTVDGATPPGAVKVEQGAEIRTASGGQVLLFAPESVTNEGRIVTPDGQTILAAGSQIFLATSTDPDLRGLLVEVGAGGTVTNGAASNATVTDPTRLAGQIIAERGNVTLAGLAVNQLGRVSANTSVRSNGSIRLLARDGAQLTTVDGRIQPLAQRGGSLTLGENSLTSVTLDDADDSTQVDVNAQLRSQVEMFGSRVDLLRRSQVIATSGEVAVTALADPRISPENFAAQPDSSRIFMAADSRIDVSGAHVELPMESNVVRVELRGSQLADSPMQRDGALRGQAVFVDSRLTGTRPDGTTWRGTPLADVSGDLATVQRGLSERNLNGGTVSLVSQGDVILSGGSSIDLSGGTISFLDGYINTTQLVTNGRVVDIGAADPNRSYQGLANGYVVEHPRWGVAETFAGFANTGQGRFERGYVQGHDAGSLSVIAPRAILDGSLTADVAIGPRQRLPSLPVPASSLYRPQDQLPLGGRLQLGLDNSQAELPNYVAQSIEFAPGMLLSDQFPADLSGIRVRPEMLESGGINRIAAFANGEVSVGDDVALRLAPGGEISLTGNSIGILGDIAAPAGRINLTSQYTIASPAASDGIRVGEQAQLTARGQWVNDGTLVNAPGAQLAPRLINGGSVRITARQGGVELTEGSAIDVSAGAWRQGSGAITAGRGGTIAISATETAERQAVPFIVGAQLSAYSLASGGEISLAANEICIATSNCSQHEGVLWLAPEFFQQGGFSSYQLTANRGGLEVLPDTQIRLRQQNIELTGDPSQQASGADLNAFSRLTVLDDRVRNPTHLALTARVSPGATPFTAATFVDAPGLALGANSSITADRAARVSLRSNSWLTVDGTISAPAGDIALTLDNSVSTSEFLPSQAIWLGATARLDARGATRITSDDRGRLRGDVLDGGSVSLRADRGYVLTAPGSVIDVSGTAAELDIASGSRGLYERSLIASDAGAISLIAAEGIGISGNLLAHAGPAAGAQGGRLTVALDTSQRAAPAGDGITPVFPTSTRSVRVQSEQVPIAVAPRSAIPGFLNGIATLGVDTVVAGGFSSLQLSAGNVRGQSLGSNVVFSNGEVRFEGDSTLSLGRGIQIDAALISSSGGEAVLAAPFVSFGQAGRQEQDVTPAAQNGGGSLHIEADLIDVVGRSALTGFSQVSLASRGDIRLRGVQAQDARTLRGELLTAADLVLQADQIYPTSLTQFDLTLSGRPDGLVRILPGGDGQDVLSAGGVLRVNAPWIEQLGTLRAPLGTISLNGEQVVLGPNSTTSTSSRGLTIPLGTIQGGFDWVYGLEDDQTLVFDAAHEAVPQQRVALNANDIVVHEGSTIDVSGGGDLLAYEWISGVGGTRDVLSPTERPRQFAVLPGLDMPYAAYDSNEYRNSTLTAGDSVYLYGVDGLREGEYALLPARYALLPGAYLVTMVDGYRDIAPTERVAQLDGSTVVAGYRTTANTAFRDSRTSGFAVRTGESIQQQAQYELARANEFFFDRAAELDLAAPRIPRDAGVLALVAGRSLTLNGDLRADAADEGRGAALDISADRLRIIGASDSGSAPGEVAVAASAISALGAESVLIGGTRAQTDAGLRLDVAAQTVTVADGAQLEAPEIILVGRERVTLASGSVVRAAGETASSDSALLASGDGALLRVTSGDQARIVRSGTSGSSGTLQIAAGASIQANAGAVALESTLDSVSNGELLVAGGSLNLASSRITLAENITTASGLVLSSADLAALDLAELVLTSHSSIDVQGDATFAVDRLLLEASGLRALGGASVSITAGDVLGLSNASNRSADAAVPVIPGASLSLHAGEIQLGTGTFRVEGFDAATLSGSEAVRAVDRGGLLAGGTLDLVTPRVTAASGADYAISAAGVLRIAAMPAAGVADVADEALGAKLALQGHSIDISGRIELAAGSLTATSMGSGATDDVSIRNGAVIDVGGRSILFDSVPVFAHGGDIKLTSAAGSVLVDAGATLDVRGSAQGGDAGSIAVSAAQGTAQLSGSLLGGATMGFTGGAIDVDAASIAQFAPLNQSLNANGWTEHREFRLRGTGDLIVASGAENAMRAREVTLTADQGRIDVLGTIDAAAAHGGNVRLSARDGISVSGTIDARASLNNAAGGRIDLDAGDGALLVDSGARLAVDGGAVTAAHGGRGGQISYRAGRAAFASLLDADATNDAVRLAGTISGARRVTLEGFERVDRSGNSVLGPTDVQGDATNPLYASAESFMQNAAAYRSALGLGGDQTFSIVPGIELVSSGDLLLGTDWDLSSWRVGGEAGVLTLRAAGTLRFDGSLSDGFIGVSGEANSPAFVLPVAPSDSWSYRLAGGADLSSADTLSVAPRSVLSPGAGNVEVGSEFAPRTLVRTGTGTIDIAAGRDFVLGNADAVVYTAGVRGPGVQLVMTGRNLAQGGRPYPTDGGDISIAAQGSIKGARSNQLVTDWLWRVGRPAGSTNASATAWTVNFESFRQNVGALGGGNVAISAGQDIDNLSVSIPSIGRQVGGTTPLANAVQVTGGGYLDVRAGESIHGGSYYVGLGTGRLDAGATIGSSPADATALAPILALGDATLDVRARRDLTIETIVNPTLLPQGNSQGAASGNRASVFATYSPRSAVSLLAAAGDLRLRNEPATVVPALGSIAIGTDDQVALKVYPPRLRAAALRGDVSVDGSLSLMPSAQGNLELFADGDVIAQSAGGAVQVLLSDADPAYLPSIAAPSAGIDRFLEVLNTALTPSPNLHAPIPIHEDDADGSPARVVARSGSIIMQPQNQSDTSGFFLSRPARLVAGTDIRDVTLLGQNLSDDDVTSLLAGRDIVYSAQRSSFGNLIESAREITLDGPGRLELVAGRHIDLQTSGGVTTRGNLTNPALPDGGASVSVLAGIDVTGPRDHEEFITRYLELGAGHETDLIGYIAARTGEEDLTAEEAQQRFAQLTAYRADLLAYVRARSGRDDLTDAAALDMFRGYSRSEQQALVERVFYSELRLSGRAAASAGRRNKDFSRGFAAVETLFPGANPDLDAGETNPFKGDINLFFSRIYTLDDGDISLFAPGGQINAGLASPPAAFGIAKAPSELGIVAQSQGSVLAFSFEDFQVNESRVFAADGGDILVWSTRGDIDAGRGAKTALSAPPPIITFDPNGSPQVTFPAALTGSGIQTLATSDGRKPGNVDLFAPRGVVNAGDAGIVAGNLTIAATAVLGADNIQVSGVSVGVPVDAGGLGASLAGVSSVASSASNAATMAVDSGAKDQQPAASLADAALSWLEVFVVGLGDEQCDPKDTECLKRQSTRN